MSDHDHPLPPPEPDNLPLLKVVGWGIGCFVAVIVTIVALTSYFWIEREAEDEIKVMGHNSMEAQTREAAAVEAKKLTDIEKSMQKVAGEGKIK